MTHPLTTDQIEELLEAEVPCGGIRWAPIARKCSHSAALRMHGHSCIRPPGPAQFKCISCWQIWYRFQADLIARQGGISCHVCKKQFVTIESFADYRPF